MHKIVMISGKQGSGKSTLADGLEKKATELGYRPVRTRFAKILYEMHDAAVAVAKSYGIPAGPKEGEMLQWIGTEWGRKLKGENVWANALVRYVQDTIQHVDSPDYADTVNNGKPERLLFIIDDMRFENEFHAFDNSGLDVLKIRLECAEEVRKARCSYWRQNTEHPSEIGLDQYSASGKFRLYMRTDEPGGAANTLDWAFKALK